MTREQLENIIKNAEEDKMLAEERAENIKAEQDKIIVDAKMKLENMSTGYEIMECSERMAKKVKLMFLLDRFTRENGWDDRLWESNQKSKWYYTVSTKSKEIIIFSTDYYKEPCKVYFETEEICEQAVEKYRDLILEVMQSEQKPVKKKTKTYLSDLLEKYPDAEFKKDKTPRYFCPRHLGFKNVTDCNSGSNCVHCWNQEMEIDNE